MSIEKATNVLKNYESFLLIMHENPDGDAIGSSAAMSLGLKSMGKKVRMVCRDRIPETFLFLPQTAEIKNDFIAGDFDVIISLDCGDLKKTGFADRIRDFAHHRKKLINIDHHPKSDLQKLANFNVVDEGAAATGEIIFPILDHLKVRINRDIATCLLTCLYFDTGGFKHSNTTPRVLSQASLFMKWGARLGEITQNISMNRSIIALKLWGRTLLRIRFNKNLKVVSSIVTKKDLEEIGATQSDLAGVVNMINSIPNTQAAMLFYETEDGQVRASLRTESDRVDISRLASIFGGGGLKKASGFSIKGKLQQDERGEWQVRMK